MSRTHALGAAESEQVLRAAQAAPSLNNSQPWQIVVVDDGIEVYTDPSRAAPVADPAGRQRVISTGAALFNLRLGLRMLSQQATIRLFPEAARPGLVARLSIHPGRPPSMEEQRLYEAIEARHTWRAPFSTQPLPDGLPQQLTDQAATEGALLVAVTSHADQDRLATLLVAAVADQLADPARAAEQQAWLRTGPAEDGIPLRNLTEARYPIPGLPTPDPLSDPQGWQPAVRGLAYRDTLMVLATRADTPTDWVLAGCALQRVLLTATRFGLATGFLNQPLESSPLRQSLTTTFGIPGYPHLVLRLGYPASPPPPPTPRRPSGQTASPEATG
jgi:nitroreductase